MSMLPEDCEVGNRPSYMKAYLTESTTTHSLSEKDIQQEPWEPMITMA